MTNAPNALLFGATGLIGGHLLHQSLASGALRHVTAVTRRPLPVQYPRLSNLVTDLGKLPAYDWPHSVDIAFCCLGTTIRAAGSQSAFRAVDYDLVVSCATWARQLGVRHFLLVSAVGASSRSPVFYNRVKGDAEKAVAALGFERVSLFRPSLLLGERDGHRPGEAAGARVMPLLSPLLAGPLNMYKAIPARDVARAMLGQALAPAGSTCERLHWVEMLAAAARLDELTQQPRRNP